MNLKNYIGKDQKTGSKEKIMVDNVSHQGDGKFTEVKTHLVEFEGKISKHNQDFSMSIDADNKELVLNGVTYKNVKMKTKDNKLTISGSGKSVTTRRGSGLLESDKTTYLTFNKAAKQQIGTDNAQLVPK
jgi:hypothetical protein